MSDFQSLRNAVLEDDALQEQVIAINNVVTTFVPAPTESLYILNSLRVFPLGDVMVGSIT